MSIAPSYWDGQETGMGGSQAGTHWGGRTVWKDNGKTPLPRYITARFVSFKSDQTPCMLQRAELCWAGRCLRTAGPSSQDPAGTRFLNGHCHKHIQTGSVTPPSLSPDLTCNGDTGQKAQMSTALYSLAGNTFRWQTNDSMVQPFISDTAHLWNSSTLYAPTTTASVCWYSWKRLLQVCTGTLFVQPARTTHADHKPWNILLKGSPGSFTAATFLGTLPLAQLASSSFSWPALASMKLLFLVVTCCHLPCHKNQQLLDLLRIPKSS